LWIKGYISGMPKTPNIWESKQKVAGKANRIGHLVLTSEKKYRINFPDGTSEIYPEYLGKILHQREQSIKDVGRPELFNGVPVEAHTITMPVEIWKKLKQPFSMDIYGHLKKIVS
jgi:hypothetical protein